MVDLWYVNCISINKIVKQKKKMPGYEGDERYWIVHEEVYGIEVSSLSNNYWES